jgi:hypothetical protein
MKSSISLILGLIAGASLSAATAIPSSNAGEVTTMHANGSFDVTLETREPDNAQARTANIVRMSIEKKYRGALEASSSGEMLATQDDRESGTYVAIERVTGSLQGHTGSFTLVHSAVMRRGVPEAWSVSVVPDSGTDQLTELSGTMTITAKDGDHFYDFEYVLPES